MRFQILGPLRISARNRPVVVAGARRRALLAALLLRRNHIGTVDYLAEMAWDKPPASPGSNIRTCVWALRQTLRDPDGEPERLLTEPGGYRLRVEPGELDLAVFDDLVDRGRRAACQGDHRAAADHLHRAIGLWTGAPLEGQSLGRTLGAEAARLMERRASAIEQYVEACTVVGQPTTLVADLQGWVREYPLRENLWAQLMRALHRAGRQAEALEAYRQVRRLLVDDLGIEPGWALRQVHRAVLSGQPDA